MTKKTGGEPNPAPGYTIAATPGTKWVLVIEDDIPIWEILEFNLRRDGYRVLHAADGLDGLNISRSQPLDLVLLDLMLPTLGGLEICRELRADPKTRDLPIVMLTAKSDEADQLIGFGAGADDYVTKPFSVKVLLERIRVLLQRRKGDAQPADLLCRHGIELDRIAHEVRIAGKILALTPTEYRLLEGMMTQPGRAYSRLELLEFAVGGDTIVLERTIDVHIRSLRQKLGDRADVVETVRGIGYRFAREA